MKPYGGNKFGHANKCECTTCIKLKLKTYARKVDLMTEVKAPTKPGAYIPVRAHFRRQSNYLGNKAKLRKAITKWYAKRFT